MDNRERIIRLWFDMWLAKKDLGIFDVFSDNAVYIESWGPEYHGSKKIKLWFDEWNTRGTVLQWDIKQFFHKGNQTIVEWYFKNKMDAGMICTPKVRHIWRCIFLWAKQEEKTKRTRQNSKSML